MDFLFLYTHEYEHLNSISLVQLILSVLNKSDWLIVCSNTPKLFLYLNLKPSKLYKFKHILH